jgi:hypothetical protein
MTANSNYNRIIRGTAGRPIKVTFRNGRQNEVLLYPREYVNLVNKYLDLGANKKGRINAYKINRATIARFREGRGGNYNNNEVNGLLNGKYIMHRYWKGWLNKSFGTNSRAYKATWGAPRLKNFMTKMRDPTAATFNVNRGRYVRGTPAQLAAAKALARIREGRIKELARKWLELTRIRRKYPAPPLKVRGNNNWPAY